MSYNLKYKGSKIDEILENADADHSKVEQLETDIALKANETEVEELEAELATKASQSEVSEIGLKVTHLDDVYTKIDELKKAISQLPDGQAVSEQVAENTALLSSLGLCVSDGAINIMYNV